MTHTAKVAGLPLPTFRSIIYGQSKNQKQSTLSKIAKAFQCSIDCLAQSADNDNFTPNLLSEKNIILTIEHYNILQKHLNDLKISIPTSKQAKIINKLNSLYTINNKNNQKFIPDQTIIEWLVNEGQ